MKNNHIMPRIPNSIKYFIYRYIINKNKHLQKLTASLKNEGFQRTFKKILPNRLTHQEKTLINLLNLKKVKNPWKPSSKMVHDIDISVIIPTYNRAHMLKELLESWRKVARATRYSFEIIFSDDGSSDNSIEILNNADDLPLVILANPHGGAAKARNTAILKARGEKLLIIGDDIFPNEQILNQHYEKLKSLPITDAVLGECIWHPNLKVNHLMNHITNYGQEQFSFNAFPKNAYTDFRHFYTCNISIDRQFLLSEDHIFDESFYKVNFEDIELGYRLAKKGMKIFYFPNASGEHFHPYNDVRKFCIRQETAGEMALVFKRLHNEVERLVEINKIRDKWNYFNTRKRLLSTESFYDKIIAFCQYIEDNFITFESEYSHDLSTIYTKLFRFAYEKGVMQSSEPLEHNTINSVFYHVVYTEDFDLAIHSLNAKCHNPFYDEIMALVDQSSEIYLTIEAASHDHLRRLTERYRKMTPHVRFALKSEMRTEGFTYRPDESFNISENALRQIVLYLQKYPDIPNIILSFGLVDLPNIGLHHSVDNSVIFKHATPQQDFRGKVLRIFEIPNTQITKLETFTTTPIKFLDDYGFFGSCTFDANQLSRSSTFLRFKQTYDKPIIFVFPTFLAVGGVERNTAEIIDCLNAKYHFVILTFERLQQSQGTLHHQFVRNCLGVYDLAELSSHDDISDYLRILKQLYQPSIIWICNGSPWLEKNLGAIRLRFHDAKIVDQQAYDTREGWVRLYKEKNNHLLTFDAFIAVNSKIQEIFLQTSGIRQEKIALIYSVLSEDRRNEALSQPIQTLYKKYELNPLQKYIIFIGRMTPQKAPQDLLHLVRKVVDIYGQRYQFIVVGSGEESDSVSALIRHLGLEAHIITIPFVENTYELEILCDAIVFTSRYEGLSIALLEALSVGTPALSTDVGDTKLILDAYGNGMTFDSIGDIDNYLSGFRYFVTHYAKFKNNAVANKEIIAERFSKSTICNQYVALFDRLLGRSS